MIPYRSNLILTVMGVVMVVIATAAFAIAMLFIPTLPTVLAQGETVETAAPQTLYYLAADADGVQQVYQLPFRGASEPRQITRAAEDVITFSAAHDGLSVAYISAGQVWLQPIHTETPEALAEVSAAQFFGGLVFSADHQYLAYPDDGVWLLDLSTRETRQLLENLPVLPDGSNTGNARTHAPLRFVLDTDGKPRHLIVKISFLE